MKMFYLNFFKEKNVVSVQRGMKVYAKYQIVLTLQTFSSNKTKIMNDYINFNKNNC